MDISESEKIDTTMQCHFMDVMDGLNLFEIAGDVLFAKIRPVMYWQRRTPKRDALLITSNSSRLPGSTLRLHLASLIRTLLMSRFRHHYTLPTFMAYAA